MKIEEVDIHGMYVEDAKRHLERFIVNCDKDVDEILVIHGFNQGQKLKDMVHNKLKSKRIKRKLHTLNKGTTRLILK